MSGLISAMEVVRILQGARLDLGSEVATQASAQTHLAARLPLGCLLQREHRLAAGDRPDFLVDGRIVVELKANRATPKATLAQLERYAAHRCVEAVILLSNKAMCVPPTIGGKPAYFVSVGAGWL